MQAKQILMFESRKALYDWLVTSDLAIQEEELKSNEKKTEVIIPQHGGIKTYLEYVNQFSCDIMQTMAWMKPAEEEGGKPQISMIPIHIESDKLEV